MTINSTSDAKSRTAAPWSDLRALLQARHKALSTLRQFLSSRGYVEVETPMLVPSPGIDPYIDAIGTETGFYLAPSPELQMKRLLAMGSGPIFQISHCFRLGERGRQHNPEFTMLEWYRPGVDYRYLLEETEQLVLAVDHGLEGQRLVAGLAEPFARHRVDDVFERVAGFRPSVAFDEDRYFRTLVEGVEPWLASREALFLLDFPSELKSLSKLREDNPRVCERFELYIRGLEVANAFTELVDAVEQRQRFEEAAGKRAALDKAAYPVDEKFLGDLDSMPPSAGIALGVDRLLMALLGTRDIGQVMVFPFDRL